MVEHIFEIEQVHWQRQRARILSGVSCHVPRGKITGIIGPNGAGKSSLLSMMAGLITPDSGYVHFEGKPLNTYSRRNRAQHIALVEQQGVFDQDAKVHEIVALGRWPHRRWGKGHADDNAAITRACDMTQLASLYERRWRTLSGGEQQRVHLARALAQDTPVLLLDEPTNHLDIGHQLKALNGVARLTGTRVIVLHDLNHAARYCDHLILLDHGACIIQGSPEQVLTTAHIESVYGVKAHLFRSPLENTLHVSFTVQSDAHLSVGIIVFIGFEPSALFHTHRITGRAQRLGIRGRVR